jgi:hypothetical protein
MKYRNEKTHPGLESSLRSGEVARRIIIGDPHIDWRDMAEEQRAAFAKPGQVEKRVSESESDQGLTH